LSWRNVLVGSLLSVLVALSVVGLAPLRTSALPGLEGLAGAVLLPSLGYGVSGGASTVQAISDFAVLVLSQARARSVVTNSMLAERSASPFTFVLAKPRLWNGKVAQAPGAASVAVPATPRVSTAAQPSASAKQVQPAQPAPKPAQPAPKPTQPAPKPAQPAAPAGAVATPWAEVNELWDWGAPAQVIDVWTGNIFTVVRRGGWAHADVEPASRQDTATMLANYDGEWSWSRRPIVVVFGGYRLAASQHGMPHGQSSIDNNFPGHFCIHFLGSTTHGSSYTSNGTPTVDPAHQRCVQEAVGQ
jgi:hypothetical protein